jgi:hypothetical protein
VNAGICWAHAILISVDIIENPENFAEIGVISFALTGVNIVCIWISGILMFAIKVSFLGIFLFDSSIKLLDSL